MLRINIWGGSKLPIWGLGWLGYSYILVEAL